MRITAATAALIQQITQEARLKRQGNQGGDGHALGTGQDDYLFRYAVELRKKGLDQSEALILWRAKADGLTLTNPGYPWTDEDFERHWAWCEREVTPAVEPSLAAWAAQPPQVERVDNKNLGQEPYCQLAFEPDGLASQNGFITALALDCPILDAADAALRLRVIRKAMAEADSRADLHPVRRKKGRKYSRDWEDAPPAAEALYVRVLDRLVLGDAIPTSDIEIAQLDPDGEARRWLSSKEHPLLGELDGLVVALGDRTRERKDKDPYPGWSYRRPAKEGARFPVDVLAKNVAIVYIEAGDKRRLLTQESVAAKLNSDKFRDEHGLQEYRAVQRSTVHRALQYALHGELFKDTDHCRDCNGCTGVLARAERVHRFRDEHVWVCQPARYVADPVTPEIRGLAREWAERESDAPTRRGSVPAEGDEVRRVVWVLGNAHSGFTARQGWMARPHDTGRSYGALPRMQAGWREHDEGAT